MIPEQIAAFIIVNEYLIHIVCSATPLLQSEVVPAHAIKVCEGVKAEFHTFLNSALGVGECPASRLYYFPAAKNPLNTH